MQQAFHYEMPEGATSRPKTFVDVARTDLISVGVTVLNEGGETNLHAHNGEDSVYLILSGKVAFYNDQERRLVLGANDFMVLPSGTKYWFESAGDEPLEMVRIAAKDPKRKTTRTDATSRDLLPRIAAGTSTPHVRAEEIVSN